MSKVKDLKTRYEKELAAELQKKLGTKNKMAVPKVEKIVINSGIGTYLAGSKKAYGPVVENLAAISGQKPVIRKARLSVSNFKIREGDVVGVSVTLRGKRMYDFLNKLVNIVFPRVRDFRGISKKAFDGKGNYSVGFKEHTVFPEISPDDVEKIHGLQVVIKTSANNDDEGLALLETLGFPFKKNEL